MALSLQFHPAMALAVFLEAFVYLILPETGSNEKEIVHCSSHIFKTKRNNSVVIALSEGQMSYLSLIMYIFLPST